MLFARLLSKTFKKEGIVLVDSQGQKYICGKPDLQKPLTIKLLKKFKLEIGIKSRFEFSRSLYAR